MNNVSFSKHCLKRARERGLWKYVSKEKFWFDAVHLDANRAKIGRCVYAYVREKEKIVVTTMYRVAF